MEFRLWLESSRINRLPLILQGLAAEAKKAGSFEEFRKDFLRQIKHGLYWHWTDDPNFKIDPNKGPRDMSSMAIGSKVTPGLMVTSHLSYWSDYGKGGKGRPYAAIIDMSEVPRNAYFQVNRGFGNEFYVSNPSQAKVTAVLARARAFAKDKEQAKHLPSSDEALEEFYNSVVQAI